MNYNRFLVAIVDKSSPQLPSKTFLSFRSGCEFTRFNKIIKSGVEMNFTKTPIYEATSNTVVNKTVFKHCPPLNFSQEIRLKLETERWCLGFEFFLAIVSLNFTIKNIFVFLCYN